MLFPARNGEMVEVLENADSTWRCPVCGESLAFAPYDKTTGAPSHEWCPCCSIQFGWDDQIPHDAPAGTLQCKWTELREIWLRDSASGTEDQR